MTLLVAACLAVVMCAVVARAAAGPKAMVDSAGQIDAVRVGDAFVDLQTRILVPPPGYTRYLPQGYARDIRREETGDTRRWRGRIEVQKGRLCRFEQTLTEEEDVLRLDIGLTGETDVETEGARLEISLPWRLVGGGPCMLIRPADGTPGLAEDAGRRRVSARCWGVQWSSSDDPLAIDVELDRECRVDIDDRTPGGGSGCKVTVWLTGPRLARGETATLTAILQVSGRPESQAARAGLTGEEAGPFHGFGGNYCREVDSPVARYTLENLRMGWARIEMHPDLWWPDEEMDRAERAGQDQPGSRLRAELSMARQLQERGIPYVISTWSLPGWLYAEPEPGAHGIGPHPDRWGQVLECLGSYLLHARERYRVEPTLFSFNEPDLGARVHFSAEAHRDAIKRTGQHFRRMGLRTGMLLGDVANPRGTHTYIEPALADPEAMRYVGAISMHSWGEASPHEYGAWADAASRAGLPLLCGEMGLDPHVWCTGAYELYSYALRELRMYQELLLHASVQSVLYWEFTPDYPLVHPQDDGGFRLSKRFWFTKHFCNLTPAPAVRLGTRSDRPEVLATAFRAARGRVHTIHLANFGPGRKVDLDGLPAAVREFRAIRTDEQTSFEEIEAVRPSARAAELDLTPNSLLTLTNAAPLAADGPGNTGDEPGRKHLDDPRDAL
jgi:hypothetical protein